MGIIYENAVCSIAATRAAHANEGFLKDMGKHEYTAQPCIIRGSITNSTGPSKSITLPISTTTFSTCVTEAPLNTRGWVVQERALSRRILHFTEHGLFWECGSLKANARYAPDGLSSPKDFPSCRSKESLLSIARVRLTRHVCPVEWFHFVTQYSYANFTNTGDRLFALSSVARAVKPFLGRTDYLAGLWRHDLIRGLGWYCYAPRFKSRTHFEAIAPSWSWASVVGPIGFAVNGLRLWKYDLVEIVDVQVKPTLAQDEFGSVLEGRLKIKGTLESHCLPVEDKDGQMVYWDEAQEMENKSSESGKDGGCPRNDDSESPHSSQKSRLGRLLNKAYTCLPIAWTRGTISNKTFIGVLILHPIGDIRTNEKGVLKSVSSEYRRIGWAEYESWSLDYFQESLTTRGSDLGHTTGSAQRRWMNLDPGEITIL